MTRRICYLLLLCMSLTSCGYHWGQGGILSCHPLAIPYVEGDWDGSMTAALVREVSQSGCFSYEVGFVPTVLRVRIVDVFDENIGFRYDRNKKGKIKDEVVPDETRLFNVAEVAVIDVASGQVILGPARIIAHVDFDHDYYSSRNQVNVFSLGQLTDVDSAYDDAQAPLNRQLAKKIVDYLINSW